MADEHINTNTQASFLEERDGGLRFLSRSQTAKADADVPFFKLRPGLSKNTMRVYRAAWTQLVAFSTRGGFKPLELTHAQLTEFLEAPGPMRNERICAVRAVYSAHGVAMPVAPLDLAGVASRIGTCVLGLMKEPNVAALAKMADAELLEAVRSAVAKKKRTLTRE